MKSYKRAIIWLREQSPRRRNLAISAFFDLFCALITLVVPFILRARYTGDPAIQYFLGDHWTWFAGFLISGMLGIWGVASRNPFIERSATSASAGIATARGITTLAVGSMVFPNFLTILTVGALVWFRIAVTLFIAAGAVLPPNHPTHSPTLADLEVINRR